MNNTFPFSFFFFLSYQSSCSPPFCVLLRRVGRLPADILWVKRQAGALQPLPDFPRQSCLFGGGCVRHAALQCAERDDNKVHKSRLEIKVLAVFSTFICSPAGCCFSSSHHFPLRYTVCWQINSVPLTDESECLFSFP